MNKITIKDFINLNFHCPFFLPIFTFQGHFFKLNEDKLARGYKIARRQFCTRVKKENRKTKL